MEMTRPGGNRGNSQPEGRPSPGAWKPAQNAGSHISTATTAAGLLSGKKSNPAKIVGSVRFLHRTEISYITLKSAVGGQSEHNWSWANARPARGAFQIPGECW